MKTICLVGLMMTVSACGTSLLKKQSAHNGVYLRNELTRYDLQVTQILHHKDDSQKISYLSVR